MRKIFKLIGIIALAAVIGFSMAACRGGGDDDDPFEGDLAGTTWESTITSSAGGYSVTVISTLTFISDSAVTLEARTMGISTGTYNGTYTFNGRVVNVNWAAGYNGSGTYSTKGNTLTDREGHVFYKK